MLILSLPHDANIQYLPLAYFLPVDVIASYLTLSAIPRTLSGLFDSPEQIGSIQDDPFLKEIADAMAGLVFPHFGFRGWIEHYTGYFPVWQLSYALQRWAREIELLTGWGLQELLRVPPHVEIQYLDYDYVKDVMRRVVGKVIAEEGLQPVLDAVREMPCEEDFEPWDTNVRKDFIRRWYHTRSTRVQMVSLEACLEEDGHGVYAIADRSSGGFEERVAERDYFDRFKALLLPKDLKILTMRADGYTYEEVADRLGYKNHSGVIKRMRAIKKLFIKYDKENGQQ
jgi:hypothetical protein